MNRSNSKTSNPGIKGIIFDLDGTIVDVSYDWVQIKNDLETGGKPVLSFIQNLPEPEKTKKMKQLEQIEDKATKKASLKDGIKELFDFLEKMNLKKALVTNNSKRNVDFIIKKYRISFDLVMTRESGLWKPSGEAFLSVLERWKFHKNDCCVVGDSMFDVVAARDAAINRVIILSEDRNHSFPGHVKAFSTIKDLHRWFEEELN